MDSDKRLIDMWVDLEEKKIQERQNLPPRPLGSPLMAMFQDSFFGWIMYLMLLVTVTIIMSVVAVDIGSAQNIEMPDSWTAPSRTMIYQDCCCNSEVIPILNNIYNNQEYIKIQNRPSTIKEIHESTFKSSSSLSDALSK